MAIGCCSGHPTGRLGLKVLRLRRAPETIGYCSDDRAYLILSMFL